MIAGSTSDSYLEQSRFKAKVRIPFLAHNFWCVKYTTAMHAIGAVIFGLALAFALAIAGSVALVLYMDGH